jgi:hypothetical protein
MLLRLISLMACVFVFYSARGQSETVRPDSKSPEIPAVLDASYTSVSYKGAIDVFGKHLSGVFFIKTIGANHHRIVMVSEFGLSMMDFEQMDDSVKLVSCQEFLNKPALISVLANDFKTLLIPLKDFRVKKEKDNILKVKYLKRRYHYSFMGSDRQDIERIKVKEGLMGGVSYTFENDKKVIPAKIFVRHHGMPLKMELNRIKIVE